MRRRASDFAASLRQAQQLGREIRYLNSARHSKEDIAREIAERDRIKAGLICVLRSVDPCMSFEIHKNYQTRKLEITYRQRKCLHLYHYQIHPVFGFMHARIQTWFPFRVYVCINGREWLARQMDQAKLRYVRRDNTFTWLEDIPRVQALFDQQLQADWPSLLGGLVEELNPAHAEIFAQYPLRYYWAVNDSEWASDVMFRSRAALEAVYPRLLRYAMSNFGAVDVLRFLGQPVPASGKVPHRCRHEVSSNIKERAEGGRGGRHPRSTRRELATVPPYPTPGDRAVLLHWMSQALYPYALAPPCWFVARPTGAPWPCPEVAALAFFAKIALPTTCARCAEWKKGWPAGASLGFSVRSCRAGPEDKREKAPSAAGLCLTGHSRRVG